MPSNNSWNNKWSGEGKLYALVRNIPKARAEEILEIGYFHYSFGDGWAAGVDLKQIDCKQAEKIRRKSQGFCGYEWMIDEIVRYGKIYGRHPTPEELQTVAVQS
jgi:hypothetical protein